MIRSNEQLSWLGPSRQLFVSARIQQQAVAIDRWSVIIAQYCVIQLAKNSTHPSVRGVSLLYKFFLKVWTHQHFPRTQCNLERLKGNLALD